MYSEINNINKVQMEKVVDELSEFYKEYEKTQKRLKLFDFLQMLIDVF